MTTPGPELSEKDFINEGYTKNPFPAWLWLFLITILMCLLWGGSSWYADKVGVLVHESPFLQVTNRELSLFLWQNPEFMRVNAKQKSGYLPAFQYVDKISLDLPYADQYAIAPPEVLFRYHTWSRLLKEEFIERPIPLQAFRDFINYAQEWDPRYWPAAPTGYTDLVESLAKSPLEDLSVLSLQVLPLAVRIAFEGWENYFKEGEAINLIQPTMRQMKEFLQTHPHYARNYWRNIVADSTTHYLKSLTTGGVDELVPVDELTSFLRVAFYNYMAAQPKQDVPQKKTELKEVAPSKS